MKNVQHGFAHVLLLFLVVIVAVVGFVAFRFSQANNRVAVDTTESSSTQVTQKSDQPTIKHLGIDLDYYNQATKRAGDIEFRQFNTNAGGMDAIFQEYGRLGGENTPGGQRRNPQPTFMVPAGTEVHAIADGTVVEIPVLHSNDYSVMIQPKGSDLIFEVEHVKNVKVKKGDIVKAGDVIAEASDYDAKNYAGLALVEIGILKPGNPPSHVCVFDYLDDSIKNETLKKITALENAWEAFVNDENVYDQSAEVIPGCVTRDPIEG